MHRSVLVVGVAVYLVFSSGAGLSGQAVPVPTPRVPALGVGDTLDNPPPLANLSAAFEAKDIAIAMRKVGDWELQRSRPYFSQDWTFAALYTGFMAATKALSEAS
jgi:unsaturated rhamnogalacturonyl hydrolase